MGLVIDSSIAIAAERRGDTVERLLKQIASLTGDQEIGISSVGLTELVHGIYRARAVDIRERRASFIRELLLDIDVFAYDSETAWLAGRIDGEPRERGIAIPFPDLLIGATALQQGYSVFTVNTRHFQLIPGLKVIAHVP